MSLIVGVGTVALDTVEVHGAFMRDLPGGSAVYFGAAAARYAPVALVGVAGEDLPDKVLAPLAARGVDVTGIERVAGPTFRWHVRYDESGERETVSAVRGPAVRTASRLDARHRDADALFLGSTDPSVQRAVLDDAGGPGLVALDTMAHWIQEEGPALRALLERTDVFLLGETELAAFAGVEDAAEAAGVALRLGPSWVVVKRGAAGVRAYGREGGQPLEFPAVRTEGVVDPTGAGDAFAGGLVGSLVARGVRGPPSPLDMRQALTEGNRMAALAVSSYSYAALLGDP